MRESVKRLHLELGGKAPVLIFDDADLELAAETMRAASFWNAGQDCTAACRIVVGPKSYEKFVALLEQQVKTIKVGATTDKATEMGSLISAEQLKRVEGFVSRASKKAEIVLGGKTIRSKGHYYAPTIIAGPAQSSEIVQDEVFGPVVTVQRAKSDEQMVEWANDCQLRPRLVDLDERRGTCLQGLQGAAVRHRLGERSLHASERDAARRLQAVRLREGSVHVRA